MLSIYSDKERMHYPTGIQLKDVRVIEPTDGTRQNTRFALETKSGGFLVAGTYDEILDFASDIAQHLMSWAILHTSPEWFGTEEKHILERVAEDDKQDGSGSAGGTDWGDSQVGPGLTGGIFPAA